MYIEYLYGLISALLIYAAVHVQSIVLSLLFLWIALSLFLVFVAYMTNQPKIFRKRADGSIPTLIRVLFYPFMLGAQFYNYIEKRKDSKRDRHYIHHIQDDVYLASRLSVEEAMTLDEYEIKAVLDVTAEFDALDWSSRYLDIDYLNIPILDHRSPTPQQLRQALNWMDTQRRQGKAVMVHCALGRGRSLFCVAAYLLAKNPDTSVRDILKSITDIRHQAGLNKSQLKRLSKYHKQQTVSLFKPAWLIANPVSGQQKWSQHHGEIEACLGEKYNLQVVETTEDKNGGEWAKEAVEKGAELVIAAGGDGTLAEVASAIVDTEIKFGIIPLGTANALAHTLYGISSKVIPVSVALDNIMNGEAIKIDTAKCNDKTMLLVSAVGIEERMISTANRESKNESGQFAYLQGFWQAVNEDNEMELLVQFDNEQAQLIKTHSLAVANAAPFSTVLAQGDGEPDYQDGLLNITWLMPKVNATDRVADISKLLIGAVSGEQDDNVKTATAQKVTIQSQESINYVVDGEPFEASKLVISCRPASLNVMLNQDKA